MYRIIPDTTVSDQIAALPTEALPHLAEVLATLELTPWNGRPQHEDNPTGTVRRWTFGPHHAGHVIYLILDDHAKSTSSSSNGSTPRTPDTTHPADETYDGVLWLLRDFRDDWPDWPTRLAVHEPPICVACVRTSLYRCLALRQGAVTFRARQYPTAGVRGALHTGRNLAVKDDVAVTLDNPEIRWVRAISLVRELNDCTIIPLNEIAN